MTNPPEPGIYFPEFIAPDGTVLPLNLDVRPGVIGRLFSTRGVSGLGLAPRDIVASEDPTGGMIIEVTRVRERTIIWPIRMYAPTHEAFISLFREVGSLLGQSDMYGPGLLRITRAYDGSQREIPVVYQSGFEQEAEDGAWRRGGASINFYCPSPWWRDVTPTTFERWAESPRAYLAPYPSYSSGQVLGNTELQNLGQRPVWPTWTITGPLTSLTAANVRRNESFTITHNLGIGQDITISGGRAIEVLGPDGAPLFSAMNLLAGGEPWRLDPARRGFDGASQVVFTAAGAVPETSPGARDRTRVRLQFHQLYETV